MSYIWCKHPYHARLGRLRLLYLLVRGTKLLPELLVSHESNVLLLHLDRVSLRVQTPDGSDKVDKSILCFGVPLASGAPGLGPLGVWQGCPAGTGLFLAFALLLLCHSKVVCLAVIDTPVRHTLYSLTATPCTR